MARNNDFNTVIGALQYWEQTSTTSELKRVDLVLREIQSSVAKQGDVSARAAAVKQSLFDLRKEMEEIEVSWDDAPELALLQLLRIRRSLSGLDSSVITEFSDMEYWHDTQKMLSALITRVEGTLAEDQRNKIERYLNLSEIVYLYQKFIPVASAASNIRPDWLWNLNGKIRRVVRASKSRFLDADALPEHQAKEMKFELIQRSVMQGSGLFLGYGCLALLVGLIGSILGIIASALLLSIISEEIASGFLNAAEKFSPLLIAGFGALPFIASAVFRSRKLDKLERIFKQYGYVESMGEIILQARASEFRDAAKNLAAELQKYPDSNRIPTSVSKLKPEELRAIQAHHEELVAEVEQIEVKMNLA